VVIIYYVIYLVNSSGAKGVKTLLRPT